ncbi:monooxygenase [Ganoderma leucocontextum]|nr:monooxygenase [Ganoderma leucocontextum]
MSSDSTTHPRIAIIGGGMGALLILHRRGVPATLYEHGAGFNACSHLGDEFDNKSHPEGDEMRLCDGAGKLHLKLGSKGGGGCPLWGPEDVSPEIDHTDVRKLLLDTISPSLIQWDHTISSVRAVGNDQHELAFANDFTTTSDFLVGADGANSRVRPLVSPATPVYVGGNDAEISLAPETTKLPELTETIENVGECTMMAMQTSRLFCAQVNSDDRIRTYVSLGPPSDPAEAKAVLKAYFAGWPQWLLNLNPIDYCDENTIYPHALWTLPVGAGANLALLDGLELGLVLAGLQEKGTLGDVSAVAAAAAARAGREYICFA